MTEETKVIGKVEVILTLAADGNISCESELTYYEPGCFSQGCALLDAVCDLTDKLEGESYGHL